MKLPQEEMHSAAMPAEAQLIARLKAGDRVAFDTIYHMYARRLYAFALSLTSDQRDVEDILQDTFVNLWIHRAEITADSTLKSLLFTMARNRLLNVVKRAGTVVCDSDIVTERDSMEVMRDDVCPVRILEYREFEQNLMTTIEKLPATQRDVVKLSKFESLSHVEIAERMGLSVQTVKNSLSLALKTLRAHLPGKIALDIILLAGCFGTF